MKRILVLCVAALLCGCGEENNRQEITMFPAETARYLHKNAVYFPDGEGLEFSGTLRRYDLVSNEKGEFDRYTFEFTDDIMAIEGTISAILIKRGYHRKVRREDDGFFVVNYVKKGFPPVSMNYERIHAKKGANAFTRLRVIWKNA